MLLEEIWCNILAAVNMLLGDLVSLANGFLGAVGIDYMFDSPSIGC